MADPEYICLSCSKTMQEWETGVCPHCGKYYCNICGGEVSTIEEYDKQMKEMYDE